jgi:uncharacterized protein YndB with AHSA1/START domain
MHALPGGPRDRAVSHSITIDAPVAAVWRWLTTSALVERWLSDGVVQVHGDWRAGSTFRFSGNWLGTDYEDRGTVQRCETERLLEYTHWSALAGFPDRPAYHSVITFVLAPAGERTTLTVTHGHLRTKAMLGHARFHWYLALVRLRNALADA